MKRRFSPSFPKAVNFQVHVDMLLEGVQQSLKWYTEAKFCEFNKPHRGAYGKKQCHELHITGSSYRTG
jgi:hypothetical protein